MRVIELLDKYNYSSDYNKAVLLYASLINGNVEKLNAYLNIDSNLPEEEQARILNEFLETCQINGPKYVDDNLLRLARYVDYTLDEEAKYKREDLSGYAEDYESMEEEDLSKMGFRI